MPLFQIRELVPFPAGDNSTDVLINGIHFNRTALTFFNYTLYDNGTLSNNTKCYLTFSKYQPSMLANGTFINGTSCYSPINSIRTRGSIGLTFGALFAASIMFTLINLRKHGRRFLPHEKRWTVVGRRWSWYWMLFVAACGIISGITGVDVDRDYLQSMAIILQSFFYYLMLPGTLAIVWEAVRHWGSWQERQLCDRDPFLLPQDGRRGRAEFYMPLIFYLFAFLNFFMTIPRSWSSVQKQRSPAQQDALAKPSATDPRFKAGALLAFCAWLVIVYHLRHSIHYYKPRSKGPLRSCFGFMYKTPMKFWLVIPLALVRTGYAIAAAWDWSISPLKYDVQPAWLYGLGYAPVLLIVVVLNIWGYIDPNEDKALIAQRAERTASVDAELGIDQMSQKPSWWSKMHGDSHLDAEQRLRNLTSAGPAPVPGGIGGGVATHRRLERAIEMGNMPVSQRHREPEDEVEAEKKRKEEEERKAKEAEEEAKAKRTKWTEEEPNQEELKRRELLALARRSRRPQVVRSLIDDLE